MQIYCSTFKDKWVFHIIPSVHLYYETDYKGIKGIYFSFQWVRFLLVIGLNKS